LIWRSSIQTFEMFKLFIQIGERRIDKKSENEETEDLMSKTIMSKTNKRDFKT